MTPQIPRKCNQKGLEIRQALLAFAEIANVKEILQKIRPGSALGRIVMLFYSTVTVPSSAIVIFMPSRT